MTNKERSENENFQHAFDSIVFNHNPVEYDEQFGKLVESVLTEFLTKTIQAERQKREEVVEAERERVCDIYEEALANNYGETLWGDDDSNEIMKQSLDAYIDAVDREVTEALTQLNNQK